MDDKPALVGLCRVNVSPPSAANIKSMNRWRLRDAPFDIWGGGPRVFVACKLFFLPPKENNLFFWRSTSDNFFFMFRQRNFLSYAFPIMYVTIWCFFRSTYFSSISTTIFFFCPHFQQTFFFWLLRRQTIYWLNIGLMLFLFVESQGGCPPPPYKAGIPSVNEKTRY